MASRDNGLVARHYRAVADLDPRFADAMLEALRAEEIAAYADASPGDRGAYADTVLPGRPLDRLWVDGELLAQARDLLTELLPDLHELIAEGDDGSDTADDRGGADQEPLDEEAAWQVLVASFDEPATDPVPRWPVSEDLPGHGHAGGGRPGPEVEGGAHLLPRRVVRPAEQRRRRTDWPDQPASATEPASTEEGADDDLADDHFVPPPPPPLPKPAPATKRTLAAIGAGVAFVFAPHVFPNDVPSGLSYVGALTIVGGFAVLVARMRDERPPDHDSDDGAVV